jgi:hypothetical protein
MNKRFARNYQIIASYTYSKNIADVTDLNLEDGPQDPNNARDDRSLSAFDLRQRLSVAAIIESPYRGGSGKPFYERALANFYISTVVTARSGFPFNTVTGTDVNFDSNNNDRPFAVGRNTGVGQWFFSSDLRVGRKIRFSADNPVSLELIFDAFNLFNRTNGKDINNVTNGVLYLAQLGEDDVRVRGEFENTPSQFCGFTSAYAPRIIQLGAKFTF